MGKIISSLRTKALFVFALVTLLILSFYIQLATSFFRKDKNDFVQEAALTRSSSLSFLVKSQIDAALNLEQKLFNLNLSGEEQEVSDFLNQDMFIYAFFIIKKDIVKKESEKYLNEYVDETHIHFHKKFIHRRLHNGPKLSYQQFDTIPARLLLNTNIMQERTYAVTSGTQLFEVPSLIMLTYHRDRDLYTALVLDLELTTGQFEADGLFKNSLWTNQGDVVIKGGEFSDRDFLSKSFSSHEVTGVHVREHEGKNVLLAHSQIKQDGLLVISEMQTARAYKIDNLLMRKSLLYGLIAFCLSAISALLLVSAPLARLKLLLFQLHEWKKTGIYHPQVAQGSDEVSLTVEAVNQTFAAIDLRFEQEMKNRIEKIKLDEAKELSNNLAQHIFPLQSAIYTGCEVAGFFRPCARYNGAWWYHLQFQGRQLFFIAQGHKTGQHAAYEMAKLQGLLTITDLANITSPAKLMSTLNHAMKGHAIKAFMGIYHPPTKEFIFANAGHQSPVLFQQANPNELAGLCAVEGQPIGQDDDVVYKDKKIVLQGGSHLFFYSENTILAQDAKKVAIGQRGLLSLLVTIAKKTPHLPEQMQAMGQQLAQKLGRPSVEHDLLFFNIKFL